MAFLTTKPKMGTTLTEAVANKAAALRVEEGFQLNASQNFTHAAVEAMEVATQAARQAEAVEQAHKLLQDAGVDL